MSIITAQLTLSGNGITSDPLSITQSAALSVQTPVIESGTMTLNSIAIGQDLIPITITEKVFLYIKHTGVVGDPNILIKSIPSIAVGAGFGNLSPGEWSFTPIKFADPAKLKGVSCILETAGVATLEYSYFTDA